MSQQASSPRGGLGKSLPTNEVKNVRSTFGLSKLKAEINYNKRPEKCKVDIRPLKAEQKSIPTNDMKNVRSTCGLSKLRITNFAESSRYSAMATGLP